MPENHTRVLRSGGLGSVAVWLGSPEIGVLRVPLCSVLIVTGQWLTDVNVGPHLYCHQLWSCWGWREEQVGSKCQAVCLERGAVGRWDGGMLPGTRSPFPRREGGKRGRNRSPRGISPWEVSGTTLNWTAVLLHCFGISPFSCTRF